MASGPTIAAAVEGSLDEAVVCRLINHVGGESGAVYGKNGKPFLKDRIDGYNSAARHAPWVVLVDLDADADCAPPVCETWLPSLAPRMCFRVAVRAVEAWLMADAETLARFLRIARGKIAVDPESLEHPKRTMVNLARLSRSRDIRDDMVPREGSGRTEGPAYTSRLIEYATDRWQPEVAVVRADSLRRTIACLQHLVTGST